MRITDLLICKKNYYYFCCDDHLCFAPNEIVCKFRSLTHTHTLYAHYKIISLLFFSEIGNFIIPIVYIRTVKEFETYPLKNFHIRFRLLEELDSDTCFGEEQQDFNQFLSDVIREQYSDPEQFESVKLPNTAVNQLTADALSHVFNRSMLSLIPLESEKDTMC